MRSFSLIFASIIVAAGALAACAGEDPEGAADEPAEGQESDLTVLELSCKSKTTTATFDVSPGFGGAVIEGELKAGAVRSLFVCNKPAGDAGASDAGASSVVNCTERPQNVHPGKWAVAVTKSGATYEATLDRGADAGAPEKFKCTPPGRPDAGAGEGGDGAAPPVPKYTEVGPIINATCGGCHTGVFNSLAKVKQRKVQMISVISAGMMPRGNGGWRNTADGQKVLDFLRNSPEL
jgi:hypothetical protein